MLDGKKKRKKPVSIGICKLNQNAALKQCFFRKKSLHGKYVSQLPLTKAHKGLGEEFTKKCIALGGMFDNTLCFDEKKVNLDGRDGFSNFLYDPLEKKKISQKCISKWLSCSLGRFKNWLNNAISSGAG